MSTHLPALWLGLALCSAALLPAQAADTTGRLLASNCFQCHGTNGKGSGFERLAGKPAQEIFNAMKELQSGQEGETLMAKHSRGYSDDQLRQLAQWLSTH